MVLGRGNKLNRKGTNSCLGPKMRRKTLFLLLLVSLLTIGITTAVLMAHVNISNKAKVKAIGIKVYFDEACTQEVTTLDWGDVSDSKTYTVYVKNVGNAPITLTMTTEDWNPASVVKYISFTWDYDGSTIYPKTVKPVTFTLQVTNPDGIVQEEISDVSWTIVVTASQV